MIKLQFPEMFKQNPSHRVKLLLQPFNNQNAYNIFNHFRLKIYNKLHVYLYSNIFVALGEGQCKFSGFFLPSTEISFLLKEINLDLNLISISFIQPTFYLNNKNKLF